MGNFYPNSRSCNWLSFKTYFLQLSQALDRLMCARLIINALIAQRIFSPLVWQKSSNYFNSIFEHFQPLVHGRQLPQVIKIRFYTCISALENKETIEKSYPGTHLIFD